MYQEFNCQIACGVSSRTSLDYLIKAKTARNRVSALGCGLQSGIGRSGGSRIADLGAGQKLIYRGLILSGQGARTAL
jgi:hypothetical protein